MSTKPRTPAPALNAIGGQQNRAGVPRWTGQDVVIAERRVKALDLRKAGATFRQIARTLDVDVATVWADVQAEMTALRELAQAGAADLREMENARLDRFLVAIMRIVESPNSAAMAVIRAVDAGVRLSARRSKLEGLDAPTRVDLSDQTRPAGAGDGTTAIDLADLSTDELLQLRAITRKSDAANAARALALVADTTTKH